MSICELMLNMCDFAGTADRSGFPDRLKALKQMGLKLTGKEAAGIYLGFEFCENMIFHCTREKLREKICEIDELGMRIVLMIPPLHERFSGIYEDFLADILSKTPVRECVVNDYGTLIMLRKSVAWDGKITFGRLFDKSVREMRMDVTAVSEISVHKNEFFCPGAMSEFARKAAGIFGIDAFETDTLPDGILCTQAWTRDYDVHVHFPRILLSRPAYCEYENPAGDFFAKFRFGCGCGGQCRKYGKTIVRDKKRPIYKQGLSVFGIQEKTPEESICGDIRLVLGGQGL